MKMVGPAANVSNSDTRLSQLQGFGETRTTEEAQNLAIRVHNHGGDLVGTVVGLNPATTDTNTDKRNLLQMWADVLNMGRDSSPHNCGGLGRPQCVNDGYREKDDLYMHPDVTIYDLESKKEKK